MSEDLIKLLNTKDKSQYIKIHEDLLSQLSLIGDKIVNYEIWTSSVWIIISIICFIAAVYFLRRLLKYINSTDCCSDEHMPVIIGIILCGAAMVVAFVVGMFQIFDLIACFVFPEKAVIDFIEK